MKLLKQKKFTQSQKKLLYNNQNNKISIPIYLLFIILIGTYCPLIYTYFPLFGKLRIVMISTVVLLPIFITSAVNYKNYEAYKSPIFLLHVGFLILIGLSILNSYDRGITYELFTGSFKYFFWFMVIVRITDSEWRLDKTIAIFSFCGVIMAISTITNFIMGQTFEHSYRGTAIQSGIFSDPNDLALFFNICLPYLLFFLIKSKRKILPIAYVGITIVAIVLTYSRGGFLGLTTVGLGFYFLVAKTRKSYIFIYIIIIIAFLVLAPDSYKERLGTIFDWDVDEQTELTGTRVDGWKLVFKMNLIDQLLGIGAGCGFYMAGNLMSDWHLIHNAFLQIYSELGLFGLIIYLLLYYIPYKQLRNTTLDYPELFILRSKIIIISFLSYAVTVFFLPQGYSFNFYMLTAFALIQNELSKRKEELNESYSYEERISLEK